MRHSDTLSHGTGDSEMTNTEWTTKTKKKGGVAIRGKRDKEDHTL